MDPTGTPVGVAVGGAVAVGWGTGVATTGAAVGETVVAAGCGVATTGTGVADGAVTLEPAAGVDGIAVGGFVGAAAVAVAGSCGPTTVVATGVPESLGPTAAGVGVAIAGAGAVAVAGIGAAFAGGAAVAAPVGVTRSADPGGVGSASGTVAWAVVVVAVTGATPATVLDVALLGRVG